MPIYEYRCDRGHTFEVLQRMSDDPLGACQVCEAPVQRVFHPVAVHFKGSGFYNTDYGKQRKRGASEDGASADAGGGATEKASDAASGSGNGKKSETAPKAESSSSDS